MQIQVIFDHALLQSEQTLAEAIYRLQSQEEHFVPRNLCSLLPTTSERVSFEISMEGLLQPPCIDYVKIEDDDGRTGPIIFISAAGNAGKIDIFVSVLDEGGNVLARGPAFYLPGSGTEWAFAIFEPIPSGTPVHVSIHVMDCVGGVRIETYHLTIP
jgi:hypothetical protein